MPETKNKFRLRNMKVTRVDLVDRGANQGADIMFSKRDDRRSMLVEHIAKGFPQQQKQPAQPAAGAQPQQPGGAPNPMMNPMTRPKGSGSRIVRIRPEDFEVSEMNGNMMEWAIPEDKMPEGIEDAVMTMVQSGEAVTFQWMIDPLTGPPVEGQAKSAGEAFVAMRGALTNQKAMDPMQQLGGLPSEMADKPGAEAAPKADAPAAQGGTDMLSALRERLAQRKAGDKAPAPVKKSADPDRLDSTLDLIVKGLVETNVFAQTATGQDLRDILPTNLLEELANQLSA